MINQARRTQLVANATVIFYGLPIGRNSPDDALIKGNKSLAKVIVNRCESITKNPDEFKYLVDVVTQMIKETKGKTVEKVKMNVVTKENVIGGLVDSKGNLIKKNKRK